MHFHFDGYDSIKGALIRNFDTPFRDSDKHLWNFSTQLRDYSGTKLLVHLVIPKSHSRSANCVLIYFSSILLSGRPVARPTPSLQYKTHDGDGSRKDSGWRLEYPT